MTFMDTHGIVYSRASFDAMGRAGNAVWAEVALKLGSLGYAVTVWKASFATKARMSDAVMPALREYNADAAARGGAHDDGVLRLDVRDINEIVRHVVIAIISP